LICIVSTLLLLSHRQNIETVTSTLPLFCCSISHAIVTAPSATPLSPQPPSQLHQCSHLCCTIAVATLLQSYGRCRLTITSKCRMLHHCSCLSHHRSCSTITMAAPLSLSIRLSSWQHRTARGLLKNGCCNATTAPTAVLPGDSRATPFPLFLLSCLWLIVAFCCPCPSWQQGTVRELLKYGYCNAATVPAAVLPGTEE